MKAREIFAWLVILLILFVVALILLLKALEQTGL